MIEILCVYVKLHIISYFAQGVMSYCMQAVPRRSADGGPEEQHHYKTTQVYINKEETNKTFRSALILVRRSHIFLRWGFSGQPT